ncbi:uncharacterized protein LOC113229222 [Hyposmocoma kahamanoa]|uniref:uncharacterized protein LOC113229222 n=1 Tax=Hyposmocoma kahamanoa TaxID=1477025 RepID=UPI000E6D668E|nr:uncharacterized protein LOC113229222 [Hyposmocoma kahamanoa]
MLLNIFALVCVLLVNVEGHIVRRDESSSTSAAPNILESFQKNLEQFKNCIDQSLAKTVEQVNEKQLQPVLTVLGDSLNRVSKAFDDLAASTQSPKNNN